MSEVLHETVTLRQAKALIAALAHKHSLLLLSSPGVGKSECIVQAATAAGLECRSLLGTQIAPEDVSGVPHIVGQRTVFCPPRILLPEKPVPFCLFLDELPACPPEIQKAFYSLLLERRLGEHQLPPGTWVVAAGNRIEDRALVRAMSSALINRLFVLHLRVDVREWLEWGSTNGVRGDILAFIGLLPEALNRPPPGTPEPFSTPRAWTALSMALDLTAMAGLGNVATIRALVFGRVSPDDAALFCAMLEEGISGLQPVREYIMCTVALPEDMSPRWFILCRIRDALKQGDLKDIDAPIINGFLALLAPEERFVLFVDLVDVWGSHGADPILLKTLWEGIGT